MNTLEYQHHCLQKKGVTESFPFDEFVLVYKVAHKIFTLANIRSFKYINVKCDPIQAQEQRDLYTGVVPGWHMNKKHWNSLLLDEDLNDQLIYKWIDDSYDLVVAGLPKASPP